MNFRPLGGFYDMIWMFRAISQVFARGQAAKTQEIVIEMRLIKVAATQCNRCPVNVGRRSDRCDGALKSYDPGVGLGC